MPSATALASTVALRLDGPDGICPAWLEAADRRCGKPATDGLLCARHHKVAEKRYEKVAAANAKFVERRRTRAIERLPQAEAELAEVKAKYNRLEPRDYGDAAIQNLSLSRRMPSDTRIAELARLVRWRDQLEGEISSLRRVVG